MGKIATKKVEGTTTFTVLVPSLEPTFQPEKPIKPFREREFRDVNRSGSILPLPRRTLIGVSVT
jgi:hypothetical protein